MKQDLQIYRLQKEDEYRGNEAKFLGMYNVLKKTWHSEKELCNRGKKIISHCHNDVISLSDCQCFFIFGL